MTRIDYIAILTPMIAKVCVVQWIEYRIPGPTVRITASVDTFSFIYTFFVEKFTEYVQTFIYILAGLSLCVICI